MEGSLEAILFCPCLVNQVLHVMKHWYLFIRQQDRKKPRWPWPLHYVCRKMWQCGYTDLLELPVWSSRCWKLHGFIIISTYVRFRLFKVLLKNDTDQTSFQISVTWILAPNTHWPVTTFVWKGILEIVKCFLLKALLHWCILCSKDGFKLQCYI